MEALAACAIDMSCVLSRVLGGLSSGAILFLVASGLSLVFGVLGVLNFAHGALYMLGAYFGFAIARLAGVDSIGFWLALFLAPLIVGLFAAVLERLLIRPIYPRELLYQLLLTYSFVLILDGVVKLVWGASFQSIQVPQMLAGAIAIAGRPFPVYQLLIIVVACVVAISLWLLLTRTRVGRLIRAAASDSQMVNILGIDVPALRTVVFATGALLAGLGGVMAGPLRSIYPGMGHDVVVESFIVVVIGGLGSLPGAALAALLIGQVRAFSVIVFPELELALVYLIMAIVLIVRPRGLLGRDVLGG
jgi:branched-chain amino acid transport system permease protein